MTHYAVIWSFGYFYTAHKPGTSQLAWIVILGTLILTGFAYLVMIFYDMPVREFLRSKLQRTAAH